MIITRTPLRISLGGGGTDLPTYYRQRDGGFLVAAAIDKYVYVAAHTNFEPQILLKYSRVERVNHPDDIDHPLLREALKAYGIDRGIEVSSMADIPAGTGLGSSGSFTVGVLRALAAYKCQFVAGTDIAALACDIEIERLGAPVGKQDQYIAAVGGVTAFEFHADDRVDVISVPVPDGVRAHLEENLLLFYTGLRRSASAELSALDEGTKLGDDDLLKNLDEVKHAGRNTFATLCAGDLEAFAGQLTDQWSLKYRRSPSPIHQRVDAWIRLGLEAGALGGKLVGAGGGGFLLFYADAKVDLRGAMAGLGFEEVGFSFDYQGSSVIIG